MWSEQGSNHSGEKPIILRVNSPPIRLRGPAKAKVEAIRFSGAHMQKKIDDISWHGRLLQRIYS